MRGERVKESRDRLNLSQKDLADRIGISDQQVYRIEKENSLPKADTLTRLAQELSVSADYLLGLTDDPHGFSTEVPLTPMELRLILAFRRGLIVEASKAFTALAEEIDKTPVSSGKPTVDG